MSELVQIDYLTVGHITNDVVDGGMTVGGTVAYSGRIAQALGCETAVLTSAVADFDFETSLPNIHVCNVVADATATFSNIYHPEGRQQILHARANDLAAADLPHAWRSAKIVHLGPLTNEVNPDILSCFSDSLICFTPQGWMRRWDENGRVYARHWPDAERLLPLADAVILSEEDLLDDQMLIDYRRWAKLLVLTRGPGGCTIYLNGEIHHLSAPDVEEKELTGAGDIFAAAYFIRLHQTNGDPFEAGRFANDIASQAVTQTNLAEKVTHIRAYQAGI